MKIFKWSMLIMAVLITFTACGKAQEEVIPGDVAKIILNDEGVSIENTDGVQITNDIVYYEAGHDFTYGEGNEKDGHAPDEASAHTVVKITKAGTYNVSGKLSKGQIAVDLGEDAKNDENAVVTLVLNGIDISCDVAPAIIFYNVYECGNKDEATASKDVETHKAGANVIIADNTVNTVNGSYVARIYKPGSVKLSADGKTVEDAEKLHKYDGAFYSKMSMNIGGGEKGDGVLNINAENEGLDSELHLTINGGNININSGNDGINTNEDNVSVTCINGGTVKINVNGKTGEGDGIDSNGWLVINGGTVYAEACSLSADAGIDSDKGIHINGGTVIATGSMLDRIEDGGQTYATFDFAEKQKGGVTSLILKDKDGNEVFNIVPANDYSVFIYSSANLVEETYTLWSDETQLAGAAAVMFGGPGKRAPGEKPPKMPEGMEPPEDFDPEKMKPDFDPSKMPEGFDPEKMKPDFDPEKMPEGRGERPDFSSQVNLAVKTSEKFAIKRGGNMFAAIQKAS